MKMLDTTSRGVLSVALRFFMERNSAMSGWLSDMRIETIDPSNDKVISSTRMQLKNTIEPSQ